MKSKISIRFLFFITVFFILLLFVVLSPYLGRPFIYFPYLFIHLALAFFITFITVLIIDIIKKTSISWNFLFVSLALSASLYIGIKIIDMQVEQSKANAVPIINSLKIYYLENNRFPENIDELKPKYINDIPGSDMGLIGTKFFYKSQENNRDFWLSFEELNADKWIYINSRNIWVFDD